MLVQCTFGSVPFEKQCLRFVLHDCSKSSTTISAGGGKLYFTDIYVKFASMTLLEKTGTYLWLLDMMQRLQIPRSASQCLPESDSAAL